MVDPVGLPVVCKGWRWLPEPCGWLLALVVSFLLFGARASVWENARVPNASIARTISRQTPAVNRKHFEHLNALANWVRDKLRDRKNVVPFAQRWLRVNLTTHATGTIGARPAGLRRALRRFAAHTDVIFVLNSHGKGTALPPYVAGLITELDMFRPYTSPLVSPCFKWWFYPLSVP